MRIPIASQGSLNSGEFSYSNETLAGGQVQAILCMDLLDPSEAHANKLNVENGLTVDNILYHPKRARRPGNILAGMHKDPRRLGEQRGGITFAEFDNGAVASNVPGGHAW